MSDTLAADPDKPPTVFERACAGDASAFTELAARHYDYAVNGHEPPAVAYAEAAIYLRFAAATGGKRDDVIMFLYALDMLADALRTDGWDEAADAKLGEAIAFAEELASLGDDGFGDMVVKAADAAPKRALEIAQFIREASFKKTSLKSSNS
jgi:hypothetical protein